MLRLPGFVKPSCSGWPGLRLWPSPLSELFPSLVTPLAIGPWPIRASFRFRAFALIPVGDWPPGQPPVLPTALRPPGAGLDYNMVSSRHFYPGPPGGQGLKVRGRVAPSLSHSSPDGLRGSRTHPPGERCASPARALRGRLPLRWACWLHAWLGREEGDAWRREVAPRGFAAAYLLTCNIY